MKQSESTLLLSIACILVLQVKVFLRKSITFVPDAITYFFLWLDAQTSKVKTCCALRSFVDAGYHFDYFCTAEQGTNPEVLKGEWFE